MNAHRSIFPPPPPRKKVIRYIVLLFILLITIIIGNTIYSTHQESQNALEHTYSELHTKLRILLSIQNSELEKIKTISAIVREENQKYCDLMDYDNISALNYMLKALASIHGIDIAVIFDEYGELLAGYPQFNENASTHAYEMMINDRQKRVDIEEISATVLSGSSIAVPGSTRNALAFISVIHLIHDTGEVYGYVVLANLISRNKRLAQDMSEIAESEMAYYNNAEEPILTSFPKTEIPYPKTNLLTVDGETYLVRKKQIENYTGQPVGTLAAALSKTPIITQQRRMLLNHLPPFLITIFISIILLFLLKTRVFDHIRQLSTALRRVAEGSGDLTIRAEKPNGKTEPKDLDEVEYMALDFNRMMDKLEQAYHQLDETRREAESANRTKSEFLANVSHEIRTPLNAVIGFSDMLIDTGLNPTQIEYAHHIKRSGDALLSLIDDILDFSKVESGELHFEHRDFDPGRILFETFDIIRPKLDQKPIELLCRLDQNMPAKVNGDSVRFRQVLINLMSNASKFTEAGEIELSLAVAAESNNRIKLHTTVRDTGIGISEDRISSIFEPFQQEDGSTTRKYGGTGLGLSISKKIAIKMDGDVWVDVQSEKTKGREVFGTSDNRPSVGPGSTFHFTAWLKKSVQGNNVPSIPMTLSGKRVLVLDDNPTHLEILAQTLTAACLHVTALSNADETLPALEQAQSEGRPFDVCLIDIHMPGTNGYQVAKNIRKTSSPISRIPLVAMASRIKRDAYGFETAGFDAYVTKPIPNNRLYTVLEKLVPKARGADTFFPESAASLESEDHSIQEAAETMGSEITTPLRILLAEDNPVNQKLLALMLGKASYDVAIAADGNEALAKYTQTPEAYNLILMDIQMPGMDGFEATQEIRAFERSQLETRGHIHGSPTRARIPIVAMTAHAVKGDREKCLDAGMDDYLTKPVRRDALIEVVRKWLFEKGENER